MSGTPFVGRNNEFELLDDRLSLALSGQPQFLLLAGEAGVGKTRLIQEFVRGVKARDIKLLNCFGQCDSLYGQGDPLLPFRMISEQLFDDGRSRGHSSDARKWAAVVTDLVFELAPDVIGLFVPIGGLVTRTVGLFVKKFIRPDIFTLPDEFSSARAILFEQYSKLLSAISERAPLLIILDDLHWADTATIEFLFYFVRRWTNQRILILGTYRPQDVVMSDINHPLVEMEQNLQRYKLCEKLQIRWLEQEEIKVWLDAKYEKNGIPNEFTAWLFDRTEGNAFFVEEILIDLEESKKLYLNENDQWELSAEIDSKEALPDSIIAVLKQRLSRLEDKLLSILTCASVEGEEFTAEIISSVRRLDEEEVIDSLIDILEKRLALVEFQEERQILERRWLTIFQFRHTLMQEYLYNSLKSVRKRRLHQHVGNCLENLYGEVATQYASEIARHFEIAGDSEKTLRYSLAAAHNAEAAFDYLVAKDWLRLAEKQLDVSVVEPKVRTGIYYRLGKAEYVTGTFPEAEQCFHMALDCAQTNDLSEFQADILTELSFLYSGSNRSYEAVESANRALQIYRRLNQDAAEARNLVYLAFAHHKNGRHDLYGHFLNEALERYSNLQDEVGSADTHCHLGIYYRLSGDFERSIEHLHEAARIHQALGHKHKAASDYTNLGSTYFALSDDLVTAMAYYKDALALSREASVVFEQAHAYLNIARIYALEGDWPSAFTSVSDGLKLAELVQDEANIVRGYSYRGVIRLYLGDIEDATQDYDRILNMNLHERRTYWAILYNAASVQEERGALEQASQYLIASCDSLLEIVEEMPPDDRVNFLFTFDRANVFHALQRITDEEINQQQITCILSRVPNEILSDPKKSLPRFYWGAGKWT